MTVDYGLSEKVRRRKKSINTIAERMDIYKRFKIVCMSNDLKITEGLNEGMEMFIKKYGNKRNN